MTLWVKTSGAWTQQVEPTAKATTWQNLSRCFVFQNGIWKQFYGNRDNWFNSWSGDYGLFAGGYNGSVYVAYATKCTWATFVSVYTASANLSAIRTNLGGAGDSIVGLLAGGNTSGITGTTDACQWSTFVTASQFSATLTYSGGAGKFAMGSGSGPYGAVFSGGYYAAGLTQADTCPWSTLTTADTASAELTLARGGVGSAGDGNFVLFVGGSDSSAGGTPYATADLCWFDTYTTAAVASADLPTPPDTGVPGERAYLAGASDHSTLAVFAGGNLEAAPSAVADVTPFATMTCVAQPSANLTELRWGPGAAGNDVAGVFIAGYAAGSTPLDTADQCTWATLVTAANSDADLDTGKGGWGTSATSDNTWAH